MQYAEIPSDDTMIYTHYKINNLKVAEQNIEIELSNLLTWLNEANLVFSSAETKLMIITSKQMTRLIIPMIKLPTFAVKSIESMFYNSKGTTII